MLKDKFNRTINYLRLAVTDKCNLRCHYCMPEKMQFKPKKELLSFEEMLRLVSILSEHGVSKIRITGGEPFLRKDIMYFLQELSNIDKIEEVAITTNATQTLPHLDDLIKMGIRTFNVSIDSLDSDRFYKITRRDYFSEVLNCITEMQKRDLAIKLNCVVMRDHNTEDIIPFVHFTKENNVSVRFIEEMPFNGHGGYYEKLEWDYVQILQHIESAFPTIEKLKDPKNSTSLNYKVNGFKGNFGIIPAYTRNFCGSCNRIRITPDGTFKTCLYDDGIFNVKNLLREGATDEQLIQAMQTAIAHKAKDGFESEKERKIKKVSESMSSIGG